MEEMGPDSLLKRVQRTQAQLSRTGETPEINPTEDIQTLQEQATSGGFMGRIAENRLKTLAEQDVADTAKADEVRARLGLERKLQVPLSEKDKLVETEDKPEDINKILIDTFIKMEKTLTTLNPMPGESTRDYQRRAIMAVRNLGMQTTSEHPAPQSTSSEFFK